MWLALILSGGRLIPIRANLRQNKRSLVIVLARIFDVFEVLTAPHAFNAAHLLSVQKKLLQVMTSRIPASLYHRIATSQTPLSIGRRGPQLRTYASTPTGKATQPHRPGGQGDRLRIFPLIFLFCAATGTYVLMVRQRAKQAAEEAQAYRFKSSAAASRRQ